MHGCLDGKMHGCMDAWMYGWMAGWMHGCMGGWMHRSMDACMLGCMEAWMHGSIEAWMPGSMHGWMNTTLNVMTITPRRRNNDAVSWYLAPDLFYVPHVNIFSKKQFLQLPPWRRPGDMSRIKWGTMPRRQRPQKWKIGGAWGFYWDVRFELK